MRKFTGLMPIVLLMLAFSVFAGCGGSKKGGNNNQPPRTYTVTFNTNGGSAVLSVQVSSGGTLQSPATPVRADSVFEGWYSDSGLTIKAIFPYTVSQDVTLYARWRWTAGIEIMTPAQLYDVRNNLTGNYRLAADISLSAYADWEPIGVSGAPFRGKIDGNGHKITNLKIDRMTETLAGLFGYVYGGVIINLVLENVNIDGGFYAGAIAGFAGSSTITNCRSTGSITGNIDDTRGYAGGITGFANDSTITDCHGTVSINAKNYAGGITGYALGSTISDCSSAVNINSVFSAGGIAGDANNSTITDCQSTGDITGSIDTGHAGGITGDAYYSTISDCSSAVNVKTGYFSGGIAGGASYSVVTNCNSAGNITGNINMEGTVGGIIGFATDGTTITNSYSTGNISAKIGAGGIVGVIYGDSTITNSYSTGNISATMDAGGIAGGVATGSAITNCYSTGNISATSGGAGGIAGNVFNGTVTNCAAINRTITGASYAGAGRVAGYISSDSSVSNNFALSTMQATGVQFDTDPRKHGVSKTDAELKTQSSYSGAINGDGFGGLGWKFGNNDAAPWKIPAGGGYSILYWQ